MLKLKHIGIACVLALSLKYMVFKPYIISSSSMEPSLYKGDYILLNQWEKFTYKKNPKLLKYQVIAFKYPLSTENENDLTLIKRCIGIPGDTVHIQNGVISSETNNLTYDYIIDDPFSKLNWEILNEKNIHLGGKTLNNQWLLNLSEEQKNEIYFLSDSIKIKKHIEPIHYYDNSLFPSNECYTWNRDQYGPVYIPKKGDSIILNTQNIHLYKRILTEYENNEIWSSDESLFINGDTVLSYVFKENYYFMLGDNRHHSQDSRHWGFVPETNLIATCNLIVFNLDEFSYNRLLKKIK